MKLDFEIPFTNKKKRIFLTNTCSASFGVYPYLYVWYHLIIGVPVCSSFASIVDSWTNPNGKFLLVVEVLDQTLLHSLIN